jgi:hypothetical protein
VFSSSIAATSSVVGQQAEELRRHDGGEAFFMRRASLWRNAGGRGRALVSSQSGGGL